MLTMIKQTVIQKFKMPPVLWFSWVIVICLHKQVEILCEYAVILPT